MAGKGLENIRNKAKYFFDLLPAEGIRTNALQAIPFWIASLITGLVAIGFTKLFAYSESLLQLIMQGRAWMIFIMTPACFFLAWLCVRLLAPNARGSGIPQVMAAIELSTPKHDYLVNTLLSFRIMMVKILSSLLMVLGGGAVGREGPTIQIAGSIFRIINQWVPASWPKRSRQSFILTGAAAGLAAAFNTPLGGIVFAVEELARIHIRYFRTALFSAVLIAGLTAQGLLGPYLYLGYPDVRSSSLPVFLAVAGTAALAGLGGALMGRWILAVMKWKRKLGKGKALMFLFGAGLLIALIAYFINAQILGSGKVLMNTVLFTKNKDIGWDTPLWRILGSVICFNTGAAGGVFAPALASGASIGAAVAHAFEVSGPNANIIILSGMVGFLTGVTRTPFTSAILVLEMTDRHSVIFQLMLAAMISQVAALIIDRHSLYEQLKKDYLEEVLASEREESPPHEKQEKETGAG
jgi:H+/Cl- antiporter ClcA